MKDIATITVYKKRKPKKIAVPLQYGFESKTQGNKTLITPFAQASWNKVSTWWRSLIYDKNGLVISVGLPKFWDEDDHYTNLEDIKSNFSSMLFREKQDGRLIIRSVEKGKVWWRSRNSFYAEEYLPTIHQLLEQDNKLLSPNFMPDCSLQFEFCLPSERIVVEHNIPHLYLIGGTEHKTLTCFKQEQLAQLAEEIKIPLPPIVTCPSYEELYQVVKNWEHKEGVVGYDHSGFPVVRIKSYDYNARFALRFDYPPGMLKKLGEKRFKQIHQQIQDQSLQTILEQRWEMISQVGSDPIQWGKLRDKFEQENKLSYKQLQQLYI